MRKGITVTVNASDRARFHDDERARTDACDRALHSLVSDGGVIGAMSSGLGSVANNENGGWEVCWASKAALNIMMRSFAARHAGEERSFVVIAPGWLLTDMGSSQRPFVSRTASPASSTPSRAKPERLVFGFWTIGVGSFPGESRRDGPWS